VERAGEALLAGPRGTEEQRRDMRRCKLLHRPADLEHFRAGRNDSRERHVFLAPLQATVLDFQFVDVLRAIDQKSEKFRVRRLLVEVVSAAGHCLDGVRAVVVACDDDDLGFRREGENLREGS